MPEQVCNGSRMCAQRRRPDVATERGEPMPKFDTKRYEVASGVLQSTDVAELAAATAKLELATEYDSIQSDK